MKKIISSLFVLSCAGVALVYFNNIEQVEAESPSAINLATTSLKTSTTVSQKNTPKDYKSDMIVDLAQVEVISSFAQLLNGMPPHEQEKYLTLNNQLFGALDFADNSTYQTWLEQGFPSLKDLDFVSQRSTYELGNALFNNGDSYPIYVEDPSLNLPAIAAVNLIKAISELEGTLRYYLPNYQQGEPVLKSNEWPNGKQPEQVLEALLKVALPHAVIDEHKAIEYLALARYEQFSFGREGKNISAVLSYLAIADKKLGGNSNITNYVKQHYPEYIETYANLRNDL